MTRTTDYEIHCVVPTGDRCGEGALWIHETRTVYWTDINRFLIHAYDLERQTTRHWFFAEPVVALCATTRRDTLLVCLASHLLLWKPASDQRTAHHLRLHGYPQVRFNDGRVDPLGNFWVGSMRNNVNADGSLGEAGGQEGCLFRLTPSGDISEWRRGLGISNTLCWSPDRRYFYFGDTLANVLRRYQYNLRNGTIEGEQDFFAGFARGYPDGSAMDSEGCLWNCRYGGGCLVRIAPNGNVLQVVDMPVSNPTTCVFGGDDRHTLFITSAGNGAPPGERLAGSLFSLTAPVPGLEENLFQLN